MSRERIIQRARRSRVANNSVAQRRTIRDGEAPLLFVTDANNKPISINSIPAFIDIENSPPHTLSQFPKALLARARDLPGVDATLEAIDSSIFNEEEYYCLAETLLNYTREYLTTRSVAEYVLETVRGNEKEAGEVKKILYLSGHTGADYVRDMLLHGLKELMSDRYLVSETKRTLARSEATRRENENFEHPAGATTRRFRTPRRGNQKLFRASRCLQSSYEERSDND